MRRKGAQQIETLSAGFTETSFDERGYARQVPSQFPCQVQYQDAAGSQ